MSFPESVKLEAKRRANYRCVVCQQPWVEVHHIVPEADNGPDTIENAAPLCASCHNQYGDNSQLRKQLREMRDWWWARCVQTASESASSVFAEKLDNLRDLYVSGSKRQDAILGDVKNLLRTNLQEAEATVSYADTIEDALAPITAFSTGSVAPSTAFSSVAKICSKCGTVNLTSSVICYHCRNML